MRATSDERDAKGRRATKSRRRARRTLPARPERPPYRGGTLAIKDAEADSCRVIGKDGVSLLSCRGTAGQMQAEKGSPKLLALVLRQLPLKDRVSIRLQPTRHTRE